jgi:hypothetical protein
MVPTLQNSIVDAIAQIGGVTCRRYYGELSDPERPLLANGELPLVLVDFVGDTPEGMQETEFQFNLYIAHLSLSKHLAARAQKHDDALDRLDRLDRALILLDLDPGILRLGRLKKIYDARSEKGYLSIFMRQVHVRARRDWQLDRLDSAATI